MMPIATEIKDFNPAVQHVAAVIESRNVVPILGHVLVEAVAGANSASVTGTNQDMVVTAQFAATVEETTRFTVESAFVKRAASAVHGGSVSLAFDSYTTRAAIEMHDPDEPLRFLSDATDGADFPRVDAGEQPESISFSAGAFRAALASVAFCADKEGIRHYLNGVYVDRKDDGITFVATDGHRLGCSTLKCDRSDNAGDVIVPRQAVEWLIPRLRLEPEDSVITLRHNDQWMSLALPLSGLHLTLRLIDGTFPDWRRVVLEHRETDTIVSISRKELDRAMRLAMAIAPRNARSHGVLFEVDALGVTFTSESPADHRSVRTRRAAHAVLGSDRNRTIGFNAAYVRSILAALAPSEVVSLRIRDAASPCRIEAVDGDTFVLLMPMRV